MLDVCFILYNWTGYHRSWHLKCTDSIPTCCSINHSSSLTMCIRTNHLIALELNIWMPTNFPAQWKHTYHTFTAVLRLQRRIAHKKPFLCAVWHMTSASHPTHCKIIFRSLQRLVVPWRQTAEMNLHNCLPPSQFLWKWRPCSQDKQR